jgi:hypothetical protein
MGAKRCTIACEPGFGFAVIDTSPGRGESQPRGVSGRIDGEDNIVAIVVFK